MYAPLGSSSIMNAQGEDTKEDFHQLQLSILFESSNIKVCNMSTNNKGSDICLFKFDFTYRLYEIPALSFENSNHLNFEPMRSRLF